MISCVFDLGGRLGLEVPKQGGLQGGPVVQSAAGLLLQVVSGKGDASDAEEEKISRDGPAHAEVQFLPVFGAAGCLVGEEPEVIKGERELGGGCDVEADAMTVEVAARDDFFGTDTLKPSVQAAGELGKAGTEPALHDERDQQRRKYPRES